MITIPFTRANFAQEMKPLISGTHLTLEYDNIVSTLAKVASELSRQLGAALYSGICDGTAATGDHAEALNAEALDYLRRAILHFAMYHHTIYLIANIENDGITVRKSDESATIYKYQQDELENRLIGDGHFWLGELLKLLSEHESEFPAWEGSEASKLNNLPVGIADFERYTGVSDSVFLIYAAWIVREVHSECILSRILPTASLTEKMRRALCYEVLGRACQRLAYHCLPEPIRLDLNNEMGKNHAQAADARIRETVADIFIGRARSYWSEVDMEIAAADQVEARSGISPVAYRSRTVSETDKFASV